MLVEIHDNPNVIGNLGIIDVAVESCIFWVSKMRVLGNVSVNCALNWDY